MPDFGSIPFREAWERLVENAERLDRNARPYTWGGGVRSHAGDPGVIDVEGRDVTNRRRALPARGGAGGSVRGGE